MLNTQAQSQFPGAQTPDELFDARMKLFRNAVIVATGIFAGTVLGGVCGLFVYANSPTPNKHDLMFAAIQSLGIIIGVAMGYLAARSAEAQEQLLDASLKAGSTLLRRYRPKPGTTGSTINVGQRTIGSAAEGEEFLRSLLGGKA